MFRPKVSIRQSLERCLADQVKTGEIRVEDARAAANDFGVGDGWIAKFSRDSVSAAAKSDEKKKEEKKGKK